MLFWGSLFVSSPSRAEMIRLKSGGAVRGRVVTSASPGDVTVRTLTGGLIVLERRAIRKVRPPSLWPRFVPSQVAVRRGPRQIAVDGRAGGRGSRAFARAEAPVERRSARSRRARDELLAIRDAAALPVLAELASSPSEAARRLYVAILRQIAGDDSTGLLVAQSVGDPSRGVRAEARGALDAARAAVARRLYIGCLRGSPEFHGVAARGLAEIGDPQLDSVPYLIEALVEHTTQYVYEPARPLAIASAWTRWSRTSQAKMYGVPLAEGRADVLNALLKITDQPYPKFGYHVEQWRSGSPKRAHKSESGEVRRSNEEFAVTRM